MERLLKDALPGGTFADVKAGDARRMKAVRGKGNKTTERRFRAMLVRACVREWVLWPKEVPGSPDVYFPNHQVAVFLDGCYWHGCPQCGHVPSKNRAFWSAKINRNRERDRQKTERLEAKGVRVLRLWEHELADAPAECLRRLGALLSAPPE